MEPGSAVAAMGDATATGGASRGAEAPEGVMVAVGDAAATGEVNEGVEASSSGATGEGGHPHTPTVEDLLKAVEVGASDGQEAATESEAAMVGRFTATPVLRTSVVEPRGGNSGIGASEPVPFVAGDFLESADAGDILDTHGVDPSAAGHTEGSWVP